MEKRKQYHTCSRTVISYSMQHVPVFPYQFYPGHASLSDPGPGPPYLNLCILEVTLGE